MGNEFRPIQTFKTRREVEKYLDDTSHLDWVESKELQNVFVEERCLVASNGCLLIVPIGDSDKLRRRAELFSNVDVFTDDGDPIIPFVPGFRKFEDDPAAISALAREFFLSSGIGEELAPNKLAAQIDKWIQGKRRDNEIYELIRDDFQICKVCAAIGEIVKSHRSVELRWIVRQVPEPLSGEIMFVADLMAADGTIIELSHEIFGQLADPDRPSSRNCLAQSFLK